MSFSSVGLSRCESSSSVYKMKIILLPSSECGHKDEIYMNIFNIVNYKSVNFSSELGRTKEKYHLVCEKTNKGCRDP